MQQKQHMEAEVLELIKTGTIVITGVVGLVTFYKGYKEYKLSNTQKRVELFERYRSNLRDNESYAKILNLIEADDDELLTLPLVEKYQYLGFFEEIALLVNSKLVKKEIAHYMFGYLAIACWNSEDFWSNLNRDAIYWRVFRQFVDEMKTVEAEQILTPSNKKLKFKL